MQRYIAQIDGLRAVAVLLVMVDHCLGPTLLPGGHIGVDLFFVISGYVITTVLLNEYSASGEISLKAFYLRRLYRIAPALGAMCLFVVVSILVGSCFAKNLQAGAELSNVLFAVFSIMNWVRAFNVGSGGGMVGHAWSLSVEEQFYLVWPIVLLFGMRHARRRTMIACLSLAIIAVFVWRLYLALAEASPERLYNGADVRSDGLLLGCLIAFRKGRLVPRLADRLYLAPTAFLAVVAVVAPWDSRFLQLGGFSLVAFASAWIVSTTIQGEAGFNRMLKSRLALWIGKRSYSLYLWHFPILTMFAYLKVSGFWVGSFVFLLSFLAADVSYRFIETPFLRMKAGRPSRDAIAHRPQARGALASTRAN